MRDDVTARRGRSRFVVQDQEAGGQRKNANGRHALFIMDWPTINFIRAATVRLRSICLFILNESDSLGFSRAFQFIVLYTNKNWSVCLSFWNYRFLLNRCGCIHANKPNNIFYNSCLQSGANEVRYLCFRNSTWNRQHNLYEYKVTEI